MQMHKKKVKKSNKPLGTSDKSAYPDLTKPESNTSGNIASQGMQDWQNYDSKQPETIFDNHTAGNSMREPLVFESEESK